MERKFNFVIVRTEIILVKFFLNIKCDICGMLSFSAKINLVLRQKARESPPSWPQEAYCPPRNKCSLCCYVWGRGYSSPGWGYPHSCPSWGGGYPSPVLTEGVPLSLGTPKPGLEYPPQPERDLEPETWERTWDWGTPPHRVADTHLWKQYLPYPSDAGGKNTDALARCENRLKLCVHAKH